MDYLGSAHGDTKEEAIKEAEIALEGFIEDMKEDGEEIPKPETYNSLSGNIRLRLPKSLHLKLKQQAENEGVSLNAYMNYLLSSRNEARKVYKDLEFIKQCFMPNMLSGDYNIVSYGGSLNYSVDNDITKTDVMAN